jgi:hypothetical protein
MNFEQNRHKDLVDTTDCLEAVSVFRCWKNLFFVVLLVAMLLLGLCFWIMDLGLVSAEGKAQPAATAEPVQEPPPQAPAPANDVTRQVNEAAAEVAGDVNVPEAVPSKLAASKPLEFPLTFQKVHVMWTIRALDAVIILAAVLYCLTILFSLKVSMLGRLGGINHIARAFFWSLILLALVIPWQVALGWALFGVTFEPSELVRRIAEYDSYSVFVKALYWFRFVVVWAIALLCLLLAQIRTSRWSSATLRRLEVI